MRDTLDLVALQEQAEADRKQQRQSCRANIYFFIFCCINGIPAGFLFTMVLLLPGSVSPNTIDTFRNLFVIGIVLYLCWRAIRSYLQVQNYIRRIRNFLPSFVPQPSNIDAIQFSGLWIFGAIPLTLILLGLSEQLTFYAAVYFMVLGVFIIAYFVWLRWTSVYNRAEKLLHILPNYIPLLNVRAIHLLNSGQLEEGEQLLRQLLTRATGLRIYSIGVLLNNLGYCLVLAERYEDALPILESCIHILPAFSYGYANLAEWYLAQDPDF